MEARKDSNFPPHGEGRGLRPTQVIDHAEGVDTGLRRYYDLICVSLNKFAENRALISALMRRLALTLRRMGVVIYAEYAVNNVFTPGLVCRTVRHFLLRIETISDTAQSGSALQFALMISLCFGRSPPSIRTRKRSMTCPNKNTRYTISFRLNQATSPPQALKILLISALATGGLKA